MKRFPFIIIALLGMLGCSDKATEPATPVNKGELERSYISVTLTSDDTTRADREIEFEDGESEERIVKSLYIFLFDGKGRPFDLGDGKNYKAVDVNEEGNDPTTSGADGKPNVSDVKDKVLFFENYVGEYPAKIVAVINWTPMGNQYSLDALSEQMVALKGAGEAFVMSNSVYVAQSNNTDAKKVAIRATALTIDNIAKDEATALANPVRINVERIAAKVTVNTNEENLYDIGEEVNGTKVYARVLGWELYNAYNKSYLLKSINPEWTATEIGFNWNDPTRFRSYWAISLKNPFGEENKLSYEDLTNAVDASDYCGENTYNEHCTKVVVKAELVKQVGDAYEAVEIAKWYGNDYLGEAALRTVVANTLASQLYYLEGGEYKGIHFDDLKVVEFNEPNPNTQAALKSYHVFFQLSEQGEEKAWYIYSSTEGFKETAKDNVNVILGGVEPALLYKGGQAYYHTDIKHLGASGSIAEFGVVRNHVYKVNIKKITGYGTPVFDSETGFNPVTPEDISTYVSADVRILSWRVVEHRYDL